MKSERSSFRDEIYYTRPQIYNALNLNYLYNRITLGERQASKIRYSALRTLVKLKKGESPIFPLSDVIKRESKKYNGGHPPRKDYSAHNFKPDTSVPKVKMAGAFYGHAGGNMYNNYATKRAILTKAYKMVDISTRHALKGQNLSDAEIKKAVNYKIQGTKAGIRGVVISQQSHYFFTGIKNKIGAALAFVGLNSINEQYIRHTRQKYREALTHMQDVKSELKYVPKSHTNIIREGSGLYHLNYINTKIIGVGQHFQAHGTKYALAGVAVGAGILAYRNRDTIAAYAGDKRVQASLHNLKEKALVGGGFAVAGHYLAQSKNTVAQFSGRILQGLGAGLITSALAHTTNTVLNKPRMDARDAQKAAIMQQKAAKQAAKQAQTKQALLSKAEVGRRISEGLKKSNKIKHLR